MCKKLIVNLINVLPYPVNLTKLNINKSPSLLQPLIHRANQPMSQVVWGASGAKVFIRWVWGCTATPIRIATMSGMLIVAMNETCQ